MSIAGDDNVDLAVLSELAPELAKMIVAVAGDVALVLNADGVIQTIALSKSDALKAIPATWIGCKWLDTVTSDTREKIEELLRDVTTTGLSRSRHVNHRSSSGQEIPIAYSAVRLGKSGPVLAVGRDLRVVAAMQQRLIQSQQEIERDYWRRQQSEIRNHDLIQNLTEAVLVVDSSTACVLDANAAALRLFGVSRQQIIGKTTVVNPDAEQRIVEASVEAPPGHPADARSQAAPLPPVPAQSAKPRANTISQASRAAAKMLGLVEQTTDGIVITDKDGDVVLINPGFAKLTKLGDKYLARDRPLGRWLSPARGEIETILREIRRTGVLAALPARLRDELGNTIEIEFSAAVLPGEDELSIGFIIRAGKAPKSPGQLRIAPPDSAIH